MEIWQRIDDFPMYKVNPDGEVRNADTNKIKRPRLNGQGDVIIDLNRENKTLTRKLTLLVAKAYLGEPPKHFNSVIQLNGDREDCRAINLAWRPRWFVVEYNRMFATEPYNVSVQIRETGEIFGTLREACVKYGLVEATAYICAHNDYTIFPTNYHIDFLR